MERHLPELSFTMATTSGSDMLAACHKDVWKDLSVTIVSVCRSSGISPPDARKAIVFTLQRITAHRSTNADDMSPIAAEAAFVVLLTNFHRGTASSGQAFDADTRCAV